MFCYNLVMVVWDWMCTIIFCVLVIFLIIICFVKCVACYLNCSSRNLRQTVVKQKSEMARMTTTVNELHLRLEKIHVTLLQVAFPKETSKEITSFLRLNPSEYFLMLDIGESVIGVGEIPVMVSEFIGNDDEIQRLQTEVEKVDQNINQSYHDVNQLIQFFPF